MNSNETTVIFLSAGRDNTLSDALAAAGFTISTLNNGTELRDAIKNAVSGGYGKIITVDPNEGFSFGDITSVSQALNADGSVLYAGTRVHEQKKNLPATIYGFLSGLNVDDAETSLYGMSAATAKVMVNMKGDEEKFLFNMPLEARANDISVKEVKTDVPCTTQPDFSILGRSFKLYYVFIKFSIAAMIAYLVDIISFYFLERLFVGLESNMKILLATVISRILCSIATYILNRGAVFKSHNKSSGAVIRFIILSVVQLLASWLLVLGIGSLLGGGDFTNMMVKVVVDLVIFIASFSIQRDWVFKKTDGILK